MEIDLLSSRSDHMGAFQPWFGSLLVLLVRRAPTLPRGEEERHLTYPIRPRMVGRCSQASRGPRAAGAEALLEVGEVVWLAVQELVRHGTGVIIMAASS
jgi:hypothetical protein